MKTYHANSIGRGTVLKAPSVDGSKIGDKLVTDGTGQLSFETDNVLTPQDFGAKADDTTDDSAAIIACLKAAADGYGEVMFYGQYYIASSIVLTVSDPLINLVLRGEGKTQIRTDQNIIIMDFRGTTNPATDGDVTIDGIGFVGNNTGNTQAAVRCRYLKNLRIKNCDVKTLGDATTNTTAIVHTQWCEEVNVTDNHLYSNGTLSGGGIEVGNGSKAVITGNIVDGNDLTSECITVSSTLDSDRLLVTCTGNVCISPKRHGIVCGYSSNGIDNRSTFSNNVVYDCPWTGFYCQPSTDPFGRLVIANNLVSNCGGESSTGIDGGIRVAGNRGIVVTGNMVFESGVDRDGNDRAFESASIRVVVADNAVITNNICTESKNYNIVVDANPNGGNNNVIISGNMLFDARAGQLRLLSAGSGVAFGDLTITDNRIVSDTYDAKGVQLLETAGGLGGQIHMANNVIQGQAATSKAGIEVGSHFTGEIINNHIESWAVAFNEINISLADRHIGTVLRIKGNHCKDITTECYVFGNPETHVIEEPTFSGTITSKGNDNFVFFGRQLSNDNRWELFERTAAPTTGTWGQGSYLHYLNPASGGAIGLVCITGGTPGTWSDFGTDGDVFKVGTPVDNQVTVWSGDGTAEGDPNLTWTGTNLVIAGSGVIYAGNGITSATAADGELQATGGSGTDNVGGDLILKPGPSTGAGTPSSVRIQGTTAGGTGATPQTLADVVTVTNDKVGIGIIPSVGHALDVDGYCLVRGNLRIASTDGSYQLFQSSGKLVSYGGFGFRWHLVSDLSTAYDEAFIFNSTTAGLASADDEQAWVRINPLINQSGTANYVALVVDTDTTASTGSGQDYLLALRDNGTPRLLVQDDGAIVNNATTTFEASVSTTDATQTTCGSFATTTDTGYIVECNVVGRNTTDSSQVCGIKLLGTFKNDGGTLSLVGSVTTDHSGADAGVATLDASGTDIRARVTGPAANFDWKTFFKITEV